MDATYLGRPIIAKPDIQIAIECPTDKDWQSSFVSYYVGLAPEGMSFRFEIRRCVLCIYQTGRFRMGSTRETHASAFGLVQDQEGHASPQLHWDPMDYWQITYTPLSTGTIGIFFFSCSHVTFSCFRWADFGWVSLCPMISIHKCRIYYRQPLLQ